jgi:hypothetical protein
MLRRLGAVRRLGCMHRLRVPVPAGSSVGGVGGTSGADAASAASNSWCQPVVHAQPRRQLASYHYAGDPYSVLGVRRGCSDQELKKAFRQQALRWHPDRCHPDRAAAQQLPEGGAPTQAAHAERMFKQLSEAYEQITLQRSSGGGAAAADAAGRSGAGAHGWGDQQHGTWQRRQHQQQRRQRRRWQHQGQHHGQHQGQEGDSSQTGRQSLGLGAGVMFALAAMLLLRASDSSSDREVPRRRQRGGGGGGAAGAAAAPRGAVHASEAAQWQSLHSHRVGRRSQQQPTKEKEVEGGRTTRPSRQRAGGRRRADGQAGQAAGAGAGAGGDGARRRREVPAAQRPLNGRRRHGGGRGSGGYRPRSSMNGGVSGPTAAGTRFRLKPMHPGHQPASSRRGGGGLPPIGRDARRSARCEASVERAS